MQPESYFSVKWGGGVYNDFVIDEDWGREGKKGGVKDENEKQETR